MEAAFIVGFRKKRFNPEGGIPNQHFTTFHGVGWVEGHIKTNQDIYLPRNPTLLIPS